MKLILKKENISINLPSVSKTEAIRYVGEKLVELGYVEKPYVQAMLNREEEISTYMGNFLAIPHGENGAEKFVKKPGIVIVHYKDPIDFGSPVHFVIGLAAKNGESHLETLSKIAETFIDEDTVNALLKNVSIATIYDAISKGN
jgi:PTS system mannitol-specific IIC component